MVIRPGAGYGVSMTWSSKVQGQDKKKKKRRKIKDVDGVYRADMQMSREISGWPKKKKKKTLPS
jgi:hypothetical protein